MASFRFAVALVAMALVAAPTVKANDLTVGSTTSGDELGSASATLFNDPQSVEVLPGDKAALVADFTNQRLVSVSLANGDTTQYLKTNEVIGTNKPKALTVCDDGVGYYSSRNGIFEFDTSDTSPTASHWVTNFGFDGLACLTNSTHDLLFAAMYQNGIRAYKRSNGPPSDYNDFVWSATHGELMVGSSYITGLSISPDSGHLAFASSFQNHKVAVMNIDTKAVQVYGSGSSGSTDGAANVAQFGNPWDVAWTPDGSKILVNEQNWNSFTGLRFIDFETGYVSSSAPNLMPTVAGRGVTVIRGTGAVLMTYKNGFKKMQVTGVEPAVPCGNVPTVPNSDGGNNAPPSFTGDTVTYVCDTGFTEAGTSKISTCQSGTWTTVTDCQSKADFIIAYLGSSTDVDSTLKAVVEAFGKSLSGSGGGSGTTVMLHRWCQMRALQ